jgi:IrrE N-terminal-like domain
MAHATSDTLGGTPTIVGSSLLTNGRRREWRQLDLVVTEQTARGGTRLLAIGEVKAGIEPVGVDQLARLEQAEAMVPHVVGAPLKKLIVARAGFTLDLRRAARNRRDVELVDLHPLAAYRMAKQDADPAALAAWMRIGEIRAAGVATEIFDRESFGAALREARSLTRLTDPNVWFPQLQEICRRAGVVVIIEKELPGARANGVARWLSPTKALIQLSARYLRDDILWFTFFHEGAHLLLHGKRSGPRDIPPTFVDTKDSSGRSEEEADSFAADLLIPASHASRLYGMKSLNEVTVFAAEL